MYGIRMLRVGFRIKMIGSDQTCGLGDTLYISKVKDHNGVYYCTLFEKNALSFSTIDDAYQLLKKLNGADPNFGIVKINTHE